MTVPGFEPLARTFAARVTGLDLNRSLSADEIAALDAAMAEHAVLVFPETALDEDGLHRFARGFGDLDIGFKRVSRAPTRFKHEETLDMSNVGPDGALVARDHRKIVGNIANQLWHSDKLVPKAGREVFLPAVGRDHELGRGNRVRRHAGRL